MRLALACLLAAVEYRRSSDVMKILRSMPEVKDAFMVFGQYDVVVFLEAEDYAELTAVSAEINGICGVRKTETLVAG
ncbi:MAG: Lrp/AsnC ligand binding domain-containing protein [Candidatus Brockarchaeota archaeon]|nr:Lrp/AsnC ligand binding domain-containing protein [Candidatus Brockarchaeota archaeon]